MAVGLCRESSSREGEHITSPSLAQSIHTADFPSAALRFCSCLSLVSGESSLCSLVRLENCKSERANLSFLPLPTSRLPLAPLSSSRAAYAGGTLRMRSSRPPSQSTGRTYVLALPVIQMLSLRAHLARLLPSPRSAMGSNLVPPRQEDTKTVQSKVSILSSLSTTSWSCS